MARRTAGLRDEVRRYGMLLPGPDVVVLAVLPCFTWPCGPETVVSPWLLVLLLVLAGLPLAPWVAVVSNPDFLPAAKDGPERASARPSAADAMMSFFMLSPRGCAASGLELTTS